MDALSEGVESAQISEDESNVSINEADLATADPDSESGKHLHRIPRAVGSSDKLTWRSFNLW